MRGHLQSAFRSTPSETQTKFATFSRGRRSKIAKNAQTTLVVAHVWARGEAVTAEVATALETGTNSVVKKK